MDISTLGSCIAIVMICYIVGMGCKASKRISDEWIPVIMAVIGGILGAVGMGVIPDFPATDYITAVAVGMFKDATGYEILTDAMKALLSQYPGLYENETIKFEELGKESGIAFSADNGALIYSEKEDVCGTMHQVCQYPFYVVYRTASDKERQKLSVQKFLDNLGKWICREPVIINGSETRLNTFPELSQGRVIKRITRDNSYGLEPQESGVQDWLLPLSVRYENTYEVI